MPADRAAALRALEENPIWYHSIELAPGVVTPGQVDARRTARRVLPDRLDGVRALDVGTFDGFWAFEMERRGATVIATDVSALREAEWPPLHRARLERRTAELGVELGPGFRLAAAALDSAVRYETCGVYDLSADVLGGPVDLVFLGALLLHLRDPVRALEQVRGCLVPGGELVLLEPFSVRDTLIAPRRPVAHFSAVSTDFTWWLGNISALRALCRAAGLLDVRVTGIHRPRSLPTMRAVYCAISARAPRPD